nr:RNA-directed DNA polymerase, eukaryota, nucleotide-binding alpha-beta plait domain protein [Tanacetum cinerariifolium]
MGKIKDINQLSNLYIILANEGFEKVKLSYLGSHWVLLNMDSVTSKEKIMGVGSWFEVLKPVCNSFVCEERLVWVSIEEEESEGNNKNDLGSDNKHVSEMRFAQENDAEENVVGNKSGNIYQPNPTKSDNNEKASSDKDICNHSTKFQASGSILEVMDKMIKVGQTMGYNMDGCMKNIETIIGSQEDDNKVYKVGKRLLYVKRNKAISLENVTSKVVEVPQTLKSRGGQLNAAPVLEVENFTNWKKRFMSHIFGIEPQFENIISNGPFIPMAGGQKKPKAQWTADERKDANLDQRLKSLIINIPKSSEIEDFTLPNQDTDEVPSNESQRNTTDPSVVVSDSSAIDYDSADKSSVCSTPLLSLKKLDGAEPISGPKTIK